MSARGNKDSSEKRLSIRIQRLPTRLAFDKNDLFNSQLKFDSSERLAALKKEEKALTVPKSGRYLSIGSKNKFHQSVPVQANPTSQISKYTIIPSRVSTSVR